MDISRSGNKRVYLKKNIEIKITKKISKPRSNSPERPVKNLEQLFQKIEIDKKEKRSNEKNSKESQRNLKGI
jgi:hypothetical protein